MRRAGLACLALATVARAQAVPVRTGYHHKVILQMEAQRADGTWRPLRMMLDTGAQVCLLSHGAARDLVTGPFALTGLQGYAGAGRPALARKLRALRSGTQVQADLPILVTDLEGVNRWLDEPLDGVLGLSFLAGRRFTVDLPAGQLRWEDPPVQGRSIPWVPQGTDPRPWVEVTLGGRPQRALVDTGASVALVVPPQAQALTLFPDCEIAAGVDGVRTVREGHLPLQALGDTFPRQRALVGGGSCILGVPLLLGGPVTFDFRERRLILGLARGERPPWDPALDGARSLPVAWRRTERGARLEVQALPGCHRWYQAGYREGDQVLAVGALEGPALTLDALDALLRQGTLLPWTLLRRGQRITRTNPDEDPRKAPLELQP